VIPARYGSSRFPGKPLADLGGRPMIQHVYERARRAQRLQRVIVATDDERIAAAVRAFGGEVQMTRADHPSGSDRVGEVAARLPAGIIVNIQGDEPFIAPEAIDLAVQTLQRHPEAGVATLVRRCRSAAELISPNTAKVVLDANGRALYFSRSVIPFLRDEQNPERQLQAHDYFLHIGLYVYRKPFLLQFLHWPPGRLEQAERLEQLRILERGHTIVCAETEYDGLCVDTPEDLELARKKLKEYSLA